MAKQRESDERARILAHNAQVMEWGVCSMHLTDFLIVTMCAGAVVLIGILVVAIGIILGVVHPWIYHYPDNDEPEFWELLNTDTGEVLKTCGTAGEVRLRHNADNAQIEKERVENV